MHPLTFSIEFRGQTAPLLPGVLVARATAPGDGFAEGEEVLLEARLTFVDERRFDAVGTISFGKGNALRFRSLDRGTLASTPDPELRQGSASLELDDGAGVLRGACGRIVSNFLVARTGELTDRQLGVLFLEQSNEER